MNVFLNLLFDAIVGIIFSSFIVIGGWFAFRSCFHNDLNYHDLGLLVKFISGMIPFVTAIVGYYMWSQNREKKLKKYEYKHEYYNLIMKKRLKVYDYLDKNIISVLTTFVMNEYDDDCVLFHSKYEYDRFHAAMMSIFERQFWLSDNMQNSIKKINDEIVKFSNKPDGVVKQIKNKEYEIIKEKYDNLYNEFVSDMREMNQVNNFFVKKDNINDEKKIMKIDHTTMILDKIKIKIKIKITKKS